MSYINKKTQYRLYDYTYIALWNSERTTVSNIICKYIDCLEVRAIILNNYKRTYMDRVRNMIV